MEETIKTTQSHLQIATLAMVSCINNAFDYEAPDIRGFAQTALKNVARLIGLKRSQLYLGAGRDNRIYVRFNDENVGFYAFNAITGKLKPFAYDPLAWEHKTPC